MKGKVLTTRSRGVRAAAVAAALSMMTGPAAAAGMPEPTPGQLARQWEEYDIDRTKSILELQPFRTEQVAAGSEGQVYRLISLNPDVASWYLLELRGAGEGQGRFYHIENPAPDRQALAMTEGPDPALSLTGEAGTDLCRPWADGALAEARESGLPYAPLCGGRLHLRNEVPGSRTGRERVAEFLRDNVWFGEEIVGLVKSTFYADAFMRSGDVLDDADPGRIAAEIGAARMADSVVMSAATGLELAGTDTNRMEMGSWYAVQDAPGIYASALQPGRIHPDILNRRGEVNAFDYVERSADVYLVAFDLAHFEIGYERGTEHPRLEWSPRPRGPARNWNTPGPDGVGSPEPLKMPGMLNPVHADRVAATFNGGFKRAHGAFKFRDYATFNHGHHYGFVIHGTVLSKLQPNLATFYVLQDGTIGMKTWEEGDDRTLLPRISFARQNGVPLIVTDPETGEGVPGPRVRDWLGGNWYGNANAEIRTLRSGVCLKSGGDRRFLLYGYFSAHTPSSMARTFQAYGCEYAMQLDMNSLEHTYMALYTHEGGAAGTQHLASGMAQIDAEGRGGERIPRFVGFPDNRDFFYLLRKRTAP